MIKRLIECAECSRHVKSCEVACPFCGVLVRARTAPAQEPYRRLAAAASVAASVASNVGCTTSPTSPNAALAQDASMMEEDSGDDSLAPPPSGIVFYGSPGIGNQSNCPPGSPLSCYVNTDCPDGGSTRLHGTVYDPAGVNPLPNVAVFVPNDPSAPPILRGGLSSTCTGCAVTIRDYAALTVTDASGQFTLANVPTGDNVPLVMQAGKWRRAINVPKTADCKDTAVTAKSSRLPRNRGEGDLPQMAVLTGGCDNIACFLANVGIDGSEFTAPHAGGSVDVYQGLGAAGPAAALSDGVAGDCTTDACPLWSSTQSLEAYDDVLLGCECDEHNETKPAASLVALHDWIAEGGNVFATHSQTTWFKNGPADFQSIASWVDGPASGATGPFIIDSTDLRATVLASWLATVGAADANGVVSLDPAAVSTSMTTVGPNATAWIYDRGTAADASALQSGTDASAPPSGDVKAFSLYRSSASMDGGVANQCWGVINVTDIHAGGGQVLRAVGADASNAPASVPAACNARPLTAGEKLLEYQLFSPTGMCLDGQTLPPPPPED